MLHYTPVGKCAVDSVSFHDAAHGWFPIASAYMTRKRTDNTCTVTRCGRSAWGLNTVTALQQASYRRTVAVDAPRRVARMTTNLRTGNEESATGDHSKNWRFVKLNWPVYAYSCSWGGVALAEHPSRVVDGHAISRSQSAQTASSQIALLRLPRRRRTVTIATVMRGKRQMLEKMPAATLYAPTFGTRTLVICTLTTHQFCKQIKNQTACNQST